jgi:hypothetical protein
MGMLLVMVAVQMFWTKSKFGAGRRLDEMERSRKSLRPSGSAFSRRQLFR